MLGAGKTPAGRRWDRGRRNDARRKREVVNGGDLNDVLRQDPDPVGFGGLAGELAAAERWRCHLPSLGSCPRDPDV